MLKKRKCPNHYKLDVLLLVILCACVLGGRAGAHIFTALCLDTALYFGSVLMGSHPCFWLVGEHSFPHLIVTHSDT